MAAEAPTEDTVAVFDPMGSRRRPRGNATVEWGCSQEAARDRADPTSCKTATEPTPGAGWRTGVVIFEPGHTHPSQENSYGGKKQRVERK